MRKIILFAIAFAQIAAANSVWGAPANNLLNKDLGNRVPRPTTVPQPPEAKPQAQGKAEPSDQHRTVSIEFNATPLDLVFVTLGELINKTILKDPDLPTSMAITLKPKEGQQLDDKEKIFAVMTVLEMNGIHIEPYGDSDKFVRAIPRADARTEGIPLILDEDKLTDIAESTRMVSYMIHLKHITCEEAQTVINGLKSKKAPQISIFERTNTILVTDMGLNIHRMLEVLEVVDKESKGSGYKTYYRPLRYADSTLVQKAIEELVTFSKDVQAKESGNKQQQGRPQPAQSARPPNILARGQNNNNANANAAQALINSISDAERGTIRGEVKVIAISEESLNMLIINTLPCNMEMFDEVIKQLDIVTTPDVVVKVYRLKYAEADKVADMIDDLIGNAPSSKSSSKNKTATSGKPTPAAAKKSANQRSGEPKAGELSKENTTVLADERINGLVVMTTRELEPTVKSIIEEMDVKLSQVLIETCIIEVGLNHDIKTGIDWVNGIKKSADGSRYEQALGGGGGTATAIAGAATNGLALLDGAATKLPSIFTPGAGLNYAIFSESLNLAAIISLSQSDSTSKYIASPVVMTVDNKEATIEATQSRRFLTGYQSNSSSSYYGSSIVPQYEGKDIGIKIKVTPKINPNGTVMLEVEEEYSQVGPTQSIQDPNSNPVDIDTSLTRKMSADVLLDKNQTVVLGGLTETHTSISDSGIPILKDIPLIGRYLFGKTSTAEERSELLVFLTPYVLSDGDEAEAEALRRKQALSDSNAWDDHGWSKSKLADPVKAKELLRRQKQQWKNLDDEHKSQIELDKAKKARILELKERALKDKESAKKFDKELKEKEKEIEEDKAEAEKAEAEDAVDAEALRVQKNES